MNASDFEIFYNWNNSVKTNEKIQFREILARIKPLIRKQSYKSSEIEEILIAEGYRENLVKDAMNSLNTKTAEQTSEIVPDGVPMTYSDIAPKFEKVLKSSGPTNFIKIMTSGDNPLVKISKKELETFQRIADTAYENPVHLATLHAFLKPSIISELAENVCRARKIRNKCSFAKVSNGKYKITHGNHTIEASISPVNSTSNKYSASNYDKFGFPDEYVILAYEEESPYSKIKRDINL